MNKKILFISYYYYGSDAEAIQGRRLVDQLKAKGHKVDIITVLENNENAEESNGIYCVKKSKFTNRFSNALFSRAPFNWFVPDSRIFWSLNIIKTAIELTKDKNYDYLITRAQPFSVNIAGLFIKLQTNVKWIAHFSDPWTISPMHRIPYLFFLPSANLERNIFKCADRITMPSNKMRDEYLRRYPKTEILVTGHFLAAYNTKTNLKKISNTINLLHAGSFYKNRSPQKLLEVFQYTLGVKGYLKNNFEILLLGEFRDKYISMIKHFGLELNAFTIPRVSFAESQIYMQQADGLILIDTNFKDSSENMYLPSKLSDYLMEGKSILVFCSKESEVNACVHNYSNVFVVDYNCLIEDASKIVMNFIDSINKESMITPIQYTTLGFDIVDKMLE